MRIEPITGMSVGVYHINCDEFHAISVDLFIVRFVFAWVVADDE